MASKLSDHLLKAVYPELKRIASAQLSRERPGHTLCPTALINEAYLKLEGAQSLEFNDKQHFVALCGRNIRQILVEHARNKNRIKRGSGQTMLTLKDHMGEIERSIDIDVLELDDLLEQLEKLDPIQVKIVELRFFSGLTVDEIADTLDTSVSTVKRKWTMARAWLYKEMKS